MASSAALVSAVRRCPAAELASLQLQRCPQLLLLLMCWAVLAPRRELLFTSSRSSHIPCQACHQRATKQPRAGRWASSACNSVE